MEKYIRTEDGIYEIVYEEETFYKCKGNIFVSKDIFYHKGKIADTIEELCDELVIDNPKNWEHKPFIPLINWNAFLNEKSAKYQKENNIKTYGAIWTEKGLIYVAKMNEKGKLELL